MNRFQLLTVLCAVLMTAGVLGADDPPKRCGTADAGKKICMDCLTTGACPEDATDEDRKDAEKGDMCTGGEVCAVLYGVATCVTISQQSTCVCSASSVCDGYNSANVMYCGDNGPFLSTPCSEDGYSCIDGACGTLPPDLTTVAPADICKEANPDPPAFVIVKPACTSAVFCNKEDLVPGGEITCATGMFYDPEAKKCMPAPPKPCEGSCQGACPDKANCTRWLICDGKGNLIDTSECKDESKKFFSVKESACSDKEEECTPTDKCNFGMTTLPAGVTGTGPTTTGTGQPSTCSSANVGRNYPEPTNCKKYRACRSTGTNSYGYFTNECPGILVFNPTSGYCDLNSNVPSCTPPATTARPSG